MNTLGSIKIFFKFATIAIFLIPVAIVTAEPLPEFKIMTEEWKPYNFIENNKIQGISVDMFVAMLERIGSEQGRNDIKLYPWARGYMILKAKPDTILFTMTKTKERKPLFKWVCPIFENTILLHALKSRKIIINSITDLKRYKIGTYIKDVGENILIKKAGLKLSDLDRTPQQALGVIQLFAGRNDLFVGSKVTVDKICEKHGYRKEDIEPVFVLSRDVMCYAFHKEIPDAVIEKFQKAFNDLKAEGKLEELFRKYN